MCLKKYASVPKTIELPQMTQKMSADELVHNFIVQIAVLLISRQLLTDKSQFEDFVETLILRNNTPQYVIWLDDKDDFRGFGTLVSHQYPTLEAPRLARLVQLSSNEEADIAQEAETIAQDITTVICNLTGELSMACYKSLENTQQFLADNMDLHHVLKRLEQDNQLSPDDVQNFKEKPASLIDWLKDSKRQQDLYDFLGCILKEAGQDFLVEEIEDSERNEEEAIKGVDQPVQVEKAGQIGTELPEKHPGKHFKLEVPTAAMQKVVLLGEAGAGKSWLVLAITKGEAQVEHKAKETTGVDLTSYHDTKHGVMYELYDFGGDEIYHITHQFLFTPQTLYLLNVDLHDYISGKFPQSLGTWLTSVTSRVVNPSITVVGTKIDLLPNQDMKESLCHQIKKDIEATVNAAALDNLTREILSCEDALKALDNESDVSEHFYGLTKEDIIAKKMSIEKIIEQRSRYLDYVQVLPVSSKTFEGVEDLCTRMAEMTLNIQAEQRCKHSWISFREAIRRDKESCLHMKECQKIGSAAGMTESDILNALSYLHVTGQILFYNDIRGMEDIIFPYPGIVLGLFKQIFENDKKEQLHKYSLGMTERKANSHLKVLLEDKTAIFNKMLPLLKHFGLYHSGLFTPVLPTAKPEEELQSDPGKLQPGYGSISIYMEYLQNAPVGFHEAIVSRLLSIPQTKYDLLRKDAGRLYHCQTAANFKDSKTYQWKIQTLHMHTFGARIEQVEMSYSCTPMVDRIQVCGKLRSAFGLVKEISEAVMQVCQDLFPMLYMKGTIKCGGAFNSVTLEATRRHRATELMRLSQGKSLENIKHDAHKHYLDNQLYKISRDLGKEWKRLGRELGLEQETLGRIQEDYRRSEQDTQRAFQVLKLWYTKSNKGPLQFLPQLEEALNAMRKRSQADDIGDLNEKYQEKTVVNPETGDMKWSVHLTGNEGIYLCKRTNLGVVTPCKLHVSYWWENWSAHEWKEEDKEKWRPVGPMFSIKCEEMEGPVDILLPHVLHLSENEASAINTEDFKVVHIVEGTAELLSTTEVTTTHVITRFKKGSVFGPIMRSDHGKDYPTNGLFVVFAPVNLSPKCQIHVYMMSNAVHIVEYLATIEEKDGYKKWDQEAYMLQTGKNYTMDVILGENGNVPIRADPQEGLIFHVTLETGIYYKKFRVQVKVNGPMIIQDVQVKDADNDDNAAVCMVLTEAGNIAQHEENAGNSHSGPAKKDVTSIHAQIVHPPEQTWHSGRQSTVLLMIDEYDPSTCETSTINYQLVCMLIEAGVKVYCIVLVKPRSEVMEDVELLLPKRDVGDHRKPSITWLTFDHRTRYPNLPEGITHIVGHVDITSQAANTFKEQRLPAYVKVILFYYVIPEDEDYYRGNEEAMGIASKKKSICKDAAKADILFSVGPKVHDYYENEHRGIQPTPQHHLFLPEPPSIFRDTQVKYVETKRKVVLSIGPVKGAEMLKGFDLAAGAMSIVITTDPDTIWQVRNISEDDFQESKEKIKVHMKSGSVKFTPHPYGTQQELCEDLKKAHLVLMPSRAEPFGMVGLQAIAAGVPILTSSSSGLAKFVMEYAPMFRHSIVEITDSETDTIKATKELAKRITKRLTDSKAEFQEAARIREDLLESKYWMESKQLFLQACDACEP
ncbi:PREDICTED: uncharacterized protein LOC109474361 isoform X2 [Branchiostoma belcheri]|nr:PREDICTED: uncharacterized protein LOC109474361 isoform X2 [Branchiostoma belcheri]